DELDLHLHPDWQVAVAERLPRIFVGAQFIISSHSPSIMAYSKSLYKISGEGDGQRILKVESPYGRNPSDMLSNLLNSPRPRDASEKISKMYAMIDARDFAGARKTIEELNALIPDDPEIVRAEYLVRALSREAQ
ncbi:MAG: AAA family ATPase, partial [Opitutales bacterium]|nr:AAA family ATPase [Opitutales bacterium]